MLCRRLNTNEKRKQDTSTKAGTYGTVTTESQINMDDRYNYDEEILHKKLINLNENSTGLLRE